MNSQLWDFIGVHRTAESDADTQVDVIVRTIFASFKIFLNVDYAKYKNIEQLIQLKQSVGDESAYFWDWFDESGLQMLRELSQSTLTDDEDMLHFLHYRNMLLEMDIENGIIESYMTSVAETLTAIAEFIQAQSEVSATISFSEEAQLPKAFFSDYIIINKNTSTQLGHKTTYRYCTEDPASVQQDFYYA